MKKINRLFAVSAVTFALSATCAMAATTTEQFQSYAHPTLFNAEAQTIVDNNKTYQVGGKIFKTKNRLGVKNKDFVYIDSWAKDVLSLIKERSAATNTLFNPKMPILRSEMAVVLAEGFDIKTNGLTKKYSDVAQNYWANEWIARATDAGVMIGYPDKTFKPDQPITKAEVFAVIAQLIDVQIPNSALKYNGKDVQYIPNWAINCSKEVVESDLLAQVPDQDKINSDMYLSKEQVAYLVGTLRTSFASANGKIAKDKAAPDCIKAYKPVYLNVKMEDRISAKTSNIGQKFLARTTKDVTIQGKNFPANSIVKGEVIDINRPGIKNPGYVKVKFLEIKNGDCTVEFPKNITEAQASTLKNPNIVARVVGAPLSISGRAIGVAGRTIATEANIAANGVEEIGGELSDTLVDTLSLQPVAGAKRFGNSFMTLGKGIFDTTKNVVGGTFGVLYEVTDELVYVIMPSKSNQASLNPGEELLIVF